MTTGLFWRHCAAAACVALATTSAFAKGVAEPPVNSAEEFVQVCTTQLALTQEQRLSMRTYLEQEIDYMATQVANHSPAEVAELIPAEREQLQRVASHLLSPGQLRQFRELEATPKMQAYLHQMALAE